MAYFAPYVDETGLHVCQYQDILSYLVSGQQSTYGADIYVNNDDKDYQMLSILALAIYDNQQALQLAWNNRAPGTAVGTGLDSVLKLNGIARKLASYSTAPATIIGTVGTVINNGVVQDINGYNWDLPPVVTVPSGGSILVSVQCETIGAIQATATQISNIMTPTSGWISASNPSAAVAGQPVEEDSQVKARQSLTVAGPSTTMLNSTKAAIFALSGVTRAVVFENYTGSTGTDPNGLGLPPHSITAVVEGDTDANVAQAIYGKRGIGPLTNGTDSVTITDPVYNADTTIGFYRPTYVPIYVSLNVHPLSGFTSATQAAIQMAIVTYLNALQIYEEVTYSGLIGAALSVCPNLAQPQFSIKALTLDTSASPTLSVDIPVLYYQVAQGVSANVLITQV